MQVRDREREKGAQSLVLFETEKGGRREGGTQSLVLFEIET